MIQKFPPFRYLFLFGLVVLLGSVSLSGCRKYEDGPSFSLLSKEARIVGNWVARSFFRNDLDELDDYSVYNIQFTAAGRMIWRIQLVGQDVVETVGDWELANVKEAIKITFDEKDPVSGETRLLYMEIRRLTADELWVNFTDINGDNYDVQFDAI
ncbi:MAG: hypothetical protein D6722_07010 [Bacteroidetes bacterium]|nr:MAG: hypothetical protein D6722_07010 [Bacteroidota bacterium]